MKVGAVAVVNALGDVYGEGGIIAGMLNKSGTGFASTDEAMFADFSGAGGRLSENTTLVAVVTNAAFREPLKTPCRRIAGYFSGILRCRQSP